MKKVISLLLVVVLVLGLCACGSSSGGAKGLQVGYATGSLMPTQSGVPLAGGDSSRMSSGFLDEVQAIVVAVAKGEDTFLLITLDYVLSTSTYLDPLQAAITEATGIPAERTLIHCTHDHSGIDIARTGWDGEDAYRSLVYKNVSKAAVEAIEDLSSASISIGSTHAEKMAFVRHYDMKDGTTAGNGHGNLVNEHIEKHSYDADDEVQIIKFTREAEDKKDIYLVSLGAHVTTVNSTSPNSISADYPGVLRNTIKESGALCAFFQGASGDQIASSRIPGNAAFQNDHIGYGNKLAEYVLGTELTPVEGDDVVLKTWEYTGNSMKEGTEDAALMAGVQEVWDLSKKHGNYHSLTTAKVVELGLLNVHEATGLYIRMKAPATRTMTLNVMQLGSDCSMVFVPYEMFGVHGTYIKENSPFSMSFIATSGEYHQGYMPTEEACEQNYYEYDVTYYERGTGEKLAQIIVDTLTELKGAAAE